MVDRSRLIRRPAAARSTTLDVAAKPPAIIRPSSPAKPRKQGNPESERPNEGSFHSRTQTPTLEGCIVSDTTPTQPSIRPLASTRSRRLSENSSMTRSVS